MGVCLGLWRGLVGRLPRGIRGRSYILRVVEREGDGWILEVRSG